MIERMSNHLITWRWLVILSAIVIVILAGYKLPEARFSTDYRIYFSDDNQQLKEFEALQETFTKSDNVMFVVAPQNGEVFTAETLSVVEAITEDAWSLPYSIRVDSITNYQHTVAEEDDLLVDNLVTDALSLTPEALEAAKQVALTEPTIAGRLISTRAHTTAINVSMEMPGIDKATETPEVREAAQKIIDRYIEAHPEIDFYLTGWIITDSAFKDAAMYDLENIMPLAFLIATLCIAAYMWMASSSLITMISGTVATLLMIVVSIVFAMGLAIWLGYDISTPTANAPTMILTLAVADSIHILTAFFQGMKKGQDKRTAMLESLRINQQPVFLTSVTTIIGFLSLNFSDSPPFRDLGNIVAIGVCGAWFFAVTFLPAIMMVLPVRVNTQAKKESNWTITLANGLIAKPRRILLLSSLLIIGCASLLPRNELNDVWMEYFDPSMEARIATDFVLEELTGLGSIQYIAYAPEGKSISDPDFLKALDKASQYLGSQAEVRHVATFSDIMKRLNKNMHGDDESYYRLPEDNELAAQYLLLYEMSLPFGLDLNNQIDFSKTQSRITLSLDKISTAELLKLQERTKAWLDSNIEGATFSGGASSDLMFAHIGQGNIRSMLQGTGIALVIISFVLAISLKSFYYGMISFLPNVLPAVVAFGIWGYFVGQIGLGLSVVFGMTLGIVVDYSVHFLSKFLRAKRENQLSTEEAIRYAFSTVGVALIVTTVVLFANFAVLSISDFALNADMGLMTAVTIVVALLIDFFFLPPLLLVLHGSRQSVKDAKTMEQSSMEAGSSSSPQGI